jgi:hypothetical protein
MVHLPLLSGADDVKEVGSYRKLPGNKVGRNKVSVCPESLKGCVGVSLPCGKLESIETPISEPTHIRKNRYKYFSVS